MILCVTFYRQSIVFYLDLFRPSQYHFVRLTLICPVPPLVIFTETECRVVFVYPSSQIERFLGLVKEVSNF